MCTFQNLAILACTFWIVAAKCCNFITVAATNFHGRDLRYSPEHIIPVTGQASTWRLAQPVCVRLSSQMDCETLHPAETCQDPNDSMLGFFMFYMIPWFYAILRSRTINGYLQISIKQFVPTWKCPAAAHNDEPGTGAMWRRSWLKHVNLSRVILQSVGIHHM